MIVRGGASYFIPGGPPGGPPGACATPLAGLPGLAGEENRDNYSN